MDEERRSDNFSVKRITENLLVSAIVAGLLMYTAVAVLKSKAEGFEANQKKLGEQVEDVSKDVKGINLHLSTELQGHVKHDEANESEVEKRLHRLEKERDRHR